MARNIFYRDFTLAKAVALMGLIGMSCALGGVPKASTLLTEAPAVDAEIMPVSFEMKTTLCKNRCGIDL